MPATLRKGFIQRRPEALLVCMYLLTCLLTDSVGLPRIDIDSHSYLNLAQGMAEQRAFVTTDETGGYTRSYVRTPGFSAAIAGAQLVWGENAVAVVVWLQRLMWAWLIGWFLPTAICKHSGRLRWRGCLGKAVALFLPLVIVTTSTLLTETLYTVVTVAGLYWMCRGRGWRTCVSAGVLLGIATLIRPVGLWVPAIAGVFVLGAKWRQPAIVAASVKQVACAILVAFLIPALWMLQVYQHSGRFALTSLNGLAAALVMQQPIERLSKGQAAKLTPAELKFVEYTKRHHDVFWSAVLVRRDLTLSEFEAAEVAGRVAMRALKNEPSHYVAVVGKNIFNTFCSASEGLKLLSAVAGRDEVASMGMQTAAQKGEWLVFSIHLLLRAVQPFLLLGIPLYVIVRYRRALVNDLFGMTLLAASAYLVAAPILFTISYGRFAFPALPAIAWLYLLPLQTAGRLVKSPVGDAGLVAD